MTRRGIGLAEAALALALAGVALATLDVVASGRVRAASEAQLGLQLEVRALLDALVPDVHAALYIEAPRSCAEFARDGRVTLYRAAEAEARSGGVPFAGGAQQLAARRVAYERRAEDAGAALWRTEAPGVLARSPRAGGGFAYAWTADPPAPGAAAPAPSQRLAGHLAALSVAPLAFTLDPRTSRRALVPPEAGTQDQACLLLVSLTARLPGVPPPDGELALTSKVWISEKLLAFRFPEFFSTVDEASGY